MKLIRARVFEAERARRAEEKANARRELLASGDRSERVRTYNFVQDRVTDHRVGVSKCVPLHTQALTHPYHSTHSHTAVHAALLPCPAPRYSHPCCHLLARHAPHLSLACRRFGITAMLNGEFLPEFTAALKAAEDEALLATLGDSDDDADA